MRELAFGKCSRSNPWLTRQPRQDAGLARRRGETIGWPHWGHRHDAAVRYQGRHRDPRAAAGGRQRHRRVFAVAHRWQRHRHQRPTCAGFREAAGRRM